MKEEKEEEERVMDGGAEQVKSHDLEYDWWPLKPGQQSLVCEYICLIGEVANFITAAVKEMKMKTACLGKTSLLLMTDDRMNQ